jgi:hypothetical protein
MKLGVVMTDPWAFDPNIGDTDFNGQDNTPKGLRTWAKSVADQNKELQIALADVQKQLKIQSISSVFEDLGVPRSAAALYKGDADPEAIKSWVTDVKTAFGMATPNPDDSTGTTTPPLLSPEAQAQLQNFNNAGSDGRPSTGMEDIQRGVNQATTSAELIAAFQNLNR